MPTVETSDGSYQSLERLRNRVNYQPDDFYNSPNAALEFDQLLVELEEESRGIFETLWGDQTPLEQTGRTDVKHSVADDAAIKLVYPIQDIESVEYKISERSDWVELDAHRYKHTSHHLILSERPTVNAMRYRQHANPIADKAERVTWGAWASSLRVTYDRGFAEVPADIKSIQVDLIENMLGSRKLQDSLAAGSPEEMASALDSNDVLTDSLRERIGDVSKPGGVTYSI